MTKKFVFVTTQFEGYHRWKDAPDKEAFLRDWHRHIFHVTMTMEVSHGNREIEFFDLKDKLNTFVLPWLGRRFEWSCEQLAEQILNNFDAYMVEVSEDGENGATVVKENTWANTWGNWGVVQTPPADWVEPDPTIMKQVFEPYSVAYKPYPKNDYFNSGGSVPTPQLVSEQLRKFCFVGVEAEGPNKGAYVLFVPGSCTPMRFVAVLEHPKVKGKIERIYYGAGNDRLLQHTTLNAICEYAKTRNIPVDVETSSNPLLAEIVAKSIQYGFSILQYVAGEAPYVFDNRATYFKTIRDGNIRWIKNSHLGYVWDTPTNHPLFLLDTPVENAV